MSTIWKTIALDFADTQFILMLISETVLAHDVTANQGRSTRLVYNKQYSILFEIRR